MKKYIYGLLAVLSVAAIFMGCWPSFRLPQLVLAAKKRAPSLAMIPILLSSSIPASLARVTTLIVTWQ